MSSFQPSRAQRWLYQVLPTIMCLIVGGASFALSYVALRDESASLGAVPAYLAFLVPVVVDGGVVVGSTIIWANAHLDQRRNWFPFFFVAALVAVSVVVNVAHAADRTLAKGIAALPPLVLLGTLELVATQYRRHENNAGSADTTSTDTTSTDTTATDTATTDTAATDTAATDAAVAPGAPAGRPELALTDARAESPARRPTRAAAARRAPSGAGSVTETVRPAPRAAATKAAPKTPAKVTGAGPRKASGTAGSGRKALRVVAESPDESL